ncbi:MAG: hypothetical protein ACLFVP_06300 [Candidatus Bathyarchaeia archaeon]
MIFLRPIIPTLTECEAHEIMVAAKNHGAEGIVLGSLRVSSPIEERLKKASIDIEPSLISEESQVSGEKLVNISMHEVKKHLGIEAEELGLVPFYSACCANAYNTGIPCQSLCWNTKFCTDCPNNCLEKIPQVTEDSISRDVSRILQVEPEAVVIGDYSSRISIPFIPDNRKLESAIALLKTITRRIEFTQVR